MRRIYLDHASTTPVDPRVIKAMQPYFLEQYGNPGAMHQWGQKSQAAVDESRQKIADFFGCDFNEIIFTGSATESNNLAIRGIIIVCLARDCYRLILGAPAGASEARAGLFASGETVPNQPSNPPETIPSQADAICRPHIITTQIEHKSVLETCRDLRKQGFAEVTYLPVTKDGFICPEDVRKAIKENTVLVSIMYVNNEIGTVQLITEIAKVIRDFRNSKSQSTSSKQYPIFHTDAVQALNYLDCNVENLGVDLLTFSAHKIYGPKGIGGLYVKKGTSLAPIITGGNQERGLRSGTENVPSVVGFAKAVEIAGKVREREAKRTEKLRDYFIDEVLKKIKVAKLNGSPKNRIPNNANLLFQGISANKLLIALDRAGIAASAGSTCTIKTVTSSEVLLALGRTEEEAKQSIRFTLGRNTTKKDIENTISALAKIVKIMV